MLDKKELLDFLNKQSDICDEAYTNATHKGDVLGSAVQQSAMLIYISLVNKIEAGEFDKR